VVTGILVRVPELVFADAIHGLQIIEAAFENARSGRVVRPAGAPSVGDRRLHEHGRSTSATVAPVTCRATFGPV
jgi:hypothetical protein